MPISHADGNYFADDGVLEDLERSGRVVFRYCDPRGEVTEAANVNGSCRNIAGILNEGGNVLGMMPHPDRASEAVLGSTDGLPIFQSFVAALGGGR
jgi:phosphoribosylformylglycinamidine synthase